MKLTSPLKSTTTPAATSSTESLTEQEYLSVLSPGGTSYIKIPFIQNTSVITEQSPGIQSVNQMSVSDIRQVTVEENMMASAISSDNSEANQKSGGNTLVNAPKEAKSHQSVSPLKNVFIATPLGMAVSKQVHVRSLNFGHEAESVHIRQPGFGRGRKQSKITESFKGKKDIKTCKGRGIGRRSSETEKKIGIVSSVDINSVLQQNTVQHIQDVGVDFYPESEIVACLRTELPVTDKIVEARTILPHTEAVVLGSKGSTVLMSSLASEMKTAENVLPVTIMEVHAVGIGGLCTEHPSGSQQLDIINVAENGGKQAVYSTTTNRIESYLHGQLGDKAGVGIQKIQTENVLTSPGMDVESSEIKESQSCLESLQTSHATVNEILKLKSSKSQEKPEIVVKYRLDEKLQGQLHSIQKEIFHEKSRSTGSEEKQNIGEHEDAKLKISCGEEKLDYIGNDTVDDKFKSLRSVDEKQFIQSQTADEKMTTSISEGKQAIQKTISDDRSNNSKSEKNHESSEILPDCVVDLCDISSAVPEIDDSKSVLVTGKCLSGENLIWNKEGNKTQEEKKYLKTSNTSFKKSRDQNADKSRCKKVVKNTAQGNKDSSTVNRTSKQVKAKTFHTNYSGKISTVPKGHEKSQTLLKQLKKLEASENDTESDDNQSLASLLPSIRAKKCASVPPKIISATKVSPLREQSAETSKSIKNESESSIAESTVTSGIENPANIETFGIFHPNALYREPTAEIDTDAPPFSESSLSSDFVISKSTEDSGKGEVILSSDNIGELYSIFKTCKINQKSFDNCVSASNSEEEIDVESELVFDPRQQLLAQQPQIPLNDTPQSPLCGKLGRKSKSPQSPRKDWKTKAKAKSSEAECKNVFKTPQKKLLPGSKESVQTPPGRSKDNTPRFTLHKKSRAISSSMDKSQTPTKARQKSSKSKQPHLSPKSGSAMQGSSSYHAYSMSPQPSKHIEIAEIMPTLWSPLTKKGDDATYNSVTSIKLATLTEPTVTDLQDNSIGSTGDATIGVALSIEAGGKTDDSECGKSIGTEKTNVGKRKREASGGRKVNTEMFTELILVSHQSGAFMNEDMMYCISNPNAQCFGLEFYWK